MRVEKRCVVVFLIIVSFIISSCDKINFGNSAVFQCADGEIVDDIQKCPEFVAQQEKLKEEEAKENEEKNNNENNSNESDIKEVKPTTNNTDDSQLINRSVGKEENKTPNGTLYPNLNGWNVQEIVTGMGAYNKKFKHVLPGNVRYDERDKKYYSIGNSQSKILDEFYIFRSTYSPGTKEYPLNFFRIHVPIEPPKFIELTETKHNDSKFKLLYYDSWYEWSLIKCEKIESCRDIFAVKCVKGENEMYIWKHGGPGEAYTQNVKYTMQAINDDRETLDTFEEFYCTPI